MLLFEEKQAATHSGVVFALLLDTWTTATVCFQQRRAINFQFYITQKYYLKIPRGNVKYNFQRPHPQHFSNPTKIFFEQKINQTTFYQSVGSLKRPGNIQQRSLMHTRTFRYFHIFYSDLLRSSLGELKQQLLQLPKENNVFCN